MSAQPSAHLTSRAQELLAYLRSLPQRGDGKFVSGQFLGDSGLSDVARIHALTGEWIGLVGGDYFKAGATDSADVSVNRDLIDYWNEGGLVTLSTHMPNPATGGPVNDRNVDLSRLTTPGTAEYAAFRRALDDVAAGLEELKKAGVVVMYRPLHEMNGGWFWWGDRDPGQFTKLWRQVHDYLIRDKGLDNLLFVYSPTSSSDDVLRFYPGSAYVDIVALDYYGDEPQRIRGNYDRLLGTGKPFAIGEFGPGGSHIADVTSGWDFRRLLDTIKSDLPRTVWWQEWSGVWGMQNGSGVAAVLADRSVLNRPDISY